MILVDTSVWVDHLRRGNQQLAAWLTEAEVATHPFVIGELACGHLKNRREILALLHDLPLTTSVEQEELLTFIEHHRLWGQGLGFIDAHLLASACISQIPLFSLDSSLAAAAGRLGVRIGGN